MRGQEDGFLAPLCYAPLGVSASRRLPVYYLPMARDLASLVDTLAEIVGPRHVRTALPERLTYAKDGLPTHRRVPGVVVLPGNRDEVIAIVRLLGALGMPFVPRGAGTGLSGGALADGDAVLIVLTRLNRILDRRPQPAGGGGARGRQRPSLPRRRAARVAVYARPVESDRLHDRRQRSRKRGRPALPQVRRNGHARARPGGGVGGRARGGAGQPGRRAVGSRPGRAVRRLGRQLRRRDPH